MAPQRVWSKKLSQYFKRIGFASLGGIALLVVLASYFRVSAAISPAGSAVNERLSISQPVTIDLTTDSDTLHQSEPDCKYPPCD